MISTLQISNETKQKLEKMKTIAKETYEEVILRLIESYEKDIVSPEMLKEAYIVVKQDDSWNLADAEWD